MIASMPVDAHKQRDRPSIETWFAGGMTETQFDAACALHHRAFPKGARTLADVKRKKRGVWMGDGVVLGPLRSESLPQRHVVLDASGDGSVVANACTLVRRVGVEETGEAMGVLGLFDVATDPAARGRGLGEAVTRAAFDRLGADGPTVCLFQTGAARAFYERLGARVIDNEVVDSIAADPGASPFEDEVVMLYPGDAAWPTGRIDLRGPGW